MKTRPAEMPVDEQKCHSFTKTLLFATCRVLCHLLEFDFIREDDKIILGCAARSLFPAEMHQHVVALIEVDETFAFVRMNLPTT